MAKRSGFVKALLLMLLIVMVALPSSCGKENSYEWIDISVGETPTVAHSLNPRRLRTVFQDIRLEDGDRIDVVEGGILLNNEFVYIGGTSPLEPTDYGYYFYGLIDMYRDGFWMAVIDVATGEITFIKPQIT